MSWKRTDKRGFTAKQHAEMRRLYAGGMSLTKIADRAGCSAQSVSWIVKKPVKKLPRKPQVTMTPAGIQVEVRSTPKPAKQLAPEVEAYVKEAADQAQREIEEYLLWKAESAARMIGGTSFLNYYKKVSA